MESDYYEVVATFKGYPGNFEREITAWTFGVFDEYLIDTKYKDNRPHEQELAWAYDQFGGYEGWLITFTGDFGERWSETLDAHRLEWRFSLSDEEPISDEQWLLVYNAIDSFDTQWEYDSELLELIITEVKHNRNVVRHLTP